MRRVILRRICAEVCGIWRSFVCSGRIPVLVRAVRCVVDRGLESNARPMGTARCAAAPSAAPTSTAEVGHLAVGAIRHVDGTCRLVDDHVERVATHRHCGGRLGASAVLRAVAGRAVEDLRVAVAEGRARRRCQWPGRQPGPTPRRRSSLSPESAHSLR